MASKQSAYPAPLDRLLKLGEESIRTREWFDYRALGITEEQAPELIRMAADPDLSWAPTESRKVWAPIHAWRALGELRAVAAVDTLVFLLDGAEDDDWVGEELPNVFGLIGPAALPALTAYLADQYHDEHARIIASEAVWHIAMLHPQATPRCAAILFRQLMRFDEQPDPLNAFLIMRLVDMEFTRAESLMKLAFSFGAVDESVMGDYADVHHDLHETDPRKREAHRERLEGGVAFLRKYLPE